MLLKIRARKIRVRIKRVRKMRARKIRVRINRAQPNSRQLINMLIYRIERNSGQIHKVEQQNIEFYKIYDYKMLNDYLKFALA